MAAREAAIGAAAGGARLGDAALAEIAARSDAVAVRPEAALRRAVRREGAASDLRAGADAARRLSARSLYCTFAASTRHASAAENRTIRCPSATQSTGADGSQVMSWMTAPEPAHRSTKRGYVRSGEADDDRALFSGPRRQICSAGWLRGLGGAELARASRSLSLRHHLTVSRPRACERT